MNTLPLHPAVVHVPLGLALVMPLVLGGLLWAILTGRLPWKAWLIGLFLQVVILGAAFLALRTGQQDEERAEARTGEAQIAAHERAAQAFTWAVGLTLAVGAASLVLRARPRAFAAGGLATVALSVGVLALGIQTGHRGGLLVHGGTAQGAPGGGGDEQLGAGGGEAGAGANEEEEDDDN